LGKVFPIEKHDAVTVRRRRSLVSSRLVEPREGEALEMGRAGDRLHQR